jgi:hypothetical protein
MGIKYRMDFQNVEGYDCRLDFDVTGYSGDVILLQGSTRPFVLGEFNSDNDIFKPVRPQQATIEIVTDGSVTIEDFLSDNDDDITVRFDFGPWTAYWYGFISQEDISENWIDQEHVIILRADEGIGRLKNIQLQSTAGEQLVGTFTPLNLIAYAGDKSKYQSFRSHVISNLFYEGMTTTFLSTGLDQCKIDARTFEQSVNQFDDSYTVLEKINSAWCQTVFQYRGEWWIVRIPEMFIDPSQTLNVINNDRPTVGNRTSSQTRYDIMVGENESVKPIMPEMIKSFRKPSKQTTIRFNWDKFAQVVCNESFQAGAKLREFSILGVEFDAFSVDDWTWQKGATPNTPTNITDNLERWRRYASTARSLPDDDFVALVPQPTTDSWMKSCKVYVEDNDYIDISFQHRNDANITAAADVVAFVFLFGNDAKTYGYNSASRTWSEITSWALIPACTVARSTSGVDWEEFNSEAIGGTPVAGYIHVYLVHDYSNLGALYRYVKDFSFDVKPSIKNLRRGLVKGDYDRYTISKDISKTFTETVYLDDAETHTYKGAIYKSDGITLTGDRWFRRDHDSERLTFKRQNALAKWFMNRSYKTLLDVNLYGLTWDIAGTKYPIGLINTVIFADDAPTKVYGISNIKEIDFMSATWTASLTEIFDTTVPSNDPGVDDVHSFDFYYE